MSEEVVRHGAAGPTWRAPARPSDLEPEQVFVACRCGTDMSFLWPRGRPDVRCFACGARFGRPVHLPAPAAPPAWQPGPPPRLRLTRPLAALLLLVAVTAGLLGAALALAMGG